MGFRLIFLDEDTIKACIKLCQKEDHVQQVAFSTYHSCLTQVCFKCMTIRTSIEKEDAGHRVHAAEDKNGKK